MHNHGEEMPPVKVTLSLGSQAFQRDLAGTLAGRGMLSAALSFGPGA
jgi:hypothetical protein